MAKRRCPIVLCMKNVVPARQTITQHKKKTEHQTYKTKKQKKRNKHLHKHFFQHLQMHHTMDSLDMLDPAGSMTTLTPMSDAPITSSHHQLHGSYHGMNHMMGHHHGGPLGGHTPGKRS